jgi:ankyrin repeat protein
MTEFENLYSQWILKRGKIPLDKPMHRKFLLRKALIDGNMNIIKHICNPNEILDGYFDKTCLHFACSSRYNHESVPYLLSMGADPNLLTKAVTINGQFIPSISPLYIIIKKNFSYKLCNLLLAHGADINLKMGTVTALMQHLYKWGKQRETEIRYLIENGSCIDIVDDNNGYTARRLLERLGLQEYLDYADYYNMVKGAVDD